MYRHIHSIALPLLGILITISGLAQDNGFNPKTFMLGEFVFERPQRWVWVPKEDDRIQKFTIPDRDGEELAAIVMIFYPSNNGTNDHHSGTIIPSWKQQFEPRTAFRTDKEEVGGQKIYFVRVEGTQRSSKTRKEKRPDYALAAAVIETAKGTISARVSAPVSAIAEAEKELRAMIRSGL